SDPPKHTRLRGLARSAFTPRMVEAMRADIQAIVDALLEPVSQPAQPGKTAPERDAALRMDVIRDFAYPLPTAVAARMLRVPAAGRHSFRKWWYDVMAFLKHVYNSSAYNRQALRELDELTGYLRDLLNELRASPGEGLLRA